ncbi:MAG: carboxymuconolactone decarboxylase family protein [Nitriliruptoraceae bacterium]
MPATMVLDAPTADVEEVYRDASEHFGHVPNFVKVLGTNPAFCRSITDLVIRLLQDGRVPWAFKELVILKTLRASGTYYSYGAHEQLAISLGETADRIGDLNNSLWRESPHFTTAERAVFALIEQIVEDANDVGDDIWEPLRDGWDHGQLLELSALITTVINLGRMFDTLGVSDPVLFTRPVS